MSLLLTRDGGDWISRAEEVETERDPHVDD